ncbi:MAG: segregation/condensation protein A [Clostridiaceae bacterium]
MALNIKIRNFEGPFDLLLHLIKKNEMDIYEISIFEITNHYLEYLDLMKEMDLDIASEFIVTAATLLEIKSRELLPKNPIEEEEEDPKKKLIQKLIEYNKFKHVAFYLKKREDEYGQAFYKRPEIIDDSGLLEVNRDILNGKTLYDLFKIYNDLINMMKDKKNENVIQEQISLDLYKVEDKIEYIKNIVALEEKINFSNISKACSNKIEIVVTFLALLELVKSRDVKINQKSNFKDITIERVIVDE